MLAAFVAAALLIVPVGTSLAACLSGGHASAGDAPVSEQAMISQSMHHCPSGDHEADLDPAVLPDARSSFQWNVDSPADGDRWGSFEPSEFQSLLSVASVPSHLPPEARGLVNSLRSARTVVLLV